MHSKDTNEIDGVTTAYELLQQSEEILIEKKQAVKTASEMIKEASKTYGVDKSYLASARKMAFSKGKGWVGENPLMLDKKAEIKDKTSQLFMKVKDLIVCLREIGQTDWLVPYLSALEGYGIKISIDSESEAVDASAAAEVAELINSVNAYDYIKYNDDKILKESHAVKSDELNFTRPSDYSYVLGLYDKILNKKDIRDEVQNKFLRFEMLQTAMNLVSDEANNI